MTKKKQSKLSFRFIKASWLGVLCLGFALGIISQRIPELRAYTEEVIRPIERQISYTHHYTQESPIVGQPVSSFLIHRNGYSFMMDAIVIPLRFISI